MRGPLFRIAVLLVSVDAALCALGQTTGPQNPPLVIRSFAGSDLFQFYCATCHGRDGKGDGPVAQALNVRPPDLTLLTRRNAGVFPRARVEEFIANDGKQPVAAHGTVEMPVWGPLFRGLDASDTLAKVRIANVVRFIESIQRN